MSEKRYKRFYVSESENQLTIYDNEGLDDYYHLGSDGRDVKGICKLLNEQQATIKQLQDLCGESDGENAKLRIENKKLKEEKGYWKSKAMILLMQVRRLTSRMTAKEVMEFSKELEDE